MSHQTRTKHRSIQVEDVDVFYREAGDPSAPVLLLLHGFPTSSHMFRNLIPLLADAYRVIAPDLPGFGSTKVPGRGEFTYTFNRLYEVIEGFTEALELNSYALFVFDYGAPVGFRLAEANPEKVTAIISQNGNAYEEGLQEAWAPIRTYWDNPSQENRDRLRALLAEETTRFQYTHGVPDKLLPLIGPDAIAHDQAILDREPEIQLDLFRSYQTNVALYPAWQAYLKAEQPPVLATWGQNAPFFGPAGAEAFKRDVPDAEIHLLDTGHFALETHGAEVADLVKDFLARKLVSAA